MFFIGIFGTGEDKKELRTYHNVVCPNCGRLTQMRVVLYYEYFHLFFIPLFRFHKRVLVLPSCGCSVYEADADFAKDPGEAPDMSRLRLIRKKRICPGCFAEVGEGYSFCPYCGRPMD